MSDVPDRLLTILTDGKVIKGYRRARLRGRDALGLYPMPFTLQIWNLSTSDYLQLCSARKVTVKSGTSVLASGYVSNVSQRNVDDGLLTEAVFSAGLKLWESQVSVSVGAGSSVAGAVQAILSASGVMKLLSYQGTDRSFSRGQAFFGRAAECVEQALAGTGNRAYITDSGLCVVPASGLAESITLTVNDLLDSPVQAANNLVILRTKVVGWPLGKQVSVKFKDFSIRGLIAERCVDADNQDGKWEAGILLEI